MHLARPLAALAVLSLAPHAAAAQSPAPQRWVDALPGMGRPIRTVAARGGRKCLTRRLGHAAEVVAEGRERNPEA